MKKQMIFSALIALVVSLSSIGAFTLINKRDHVVKIEHISQTPAANTGYSLNHDGGALLDFNKTATKVLDGVVHIKSTQIFSGNSAPQFDNNIPDPFKDFFGDQFEYFFQAPSRNRSPNMNPQNPPMRVGTGSGVIISQEGYIVTNNHVIDNADDIEVLLNDNRTFKAKLIGTDPSTDLALLQIKADHLSTVPLVNSDAVKIGQWVLAIGSPMGLNSTVTAGIVSAKGRNININKDRYAVENFIQTDAAINPGNSGGALVNLDGGLIGINTAIASPTGSFAGYGFAVPANIVEKVVTDLLEFGTVQRGVLGVLVRSVDGSLSKEKELSINKGAYVDSLLENSAAGKGGIQKGDVIISINGVDVNSSPELQGLIATYRPGETVQVGINRRGDTQVIPITLINREGTTALTSSDSREVIKLLGADFEGVDDKLLIKLDIKGGVKVKRLYPGKLQKYTDMRAGFIITKVDGKPVKNVDDLVEILEKKIGGVLLEGIYEDIPGLYYYAFGMNN